MLKMIIATDRNGAIGDKGELPWDYLASDLRYFKEQTEGDIVVMGRKTYESLPMYPDGLPNRDNLVLSKQDKISYVQDVHYYSVERLTCCLEDDWWSKDVWIIGGATIYEQFKDIVDEVHWTYIDREYEADTFMDMSFVNSLTFRRKSVTPLAEDIDVNVFERIK